MIKEFVDIFMEHKDELRGVFSQKHPENYMAVVTTVIAFLTPHCKSILNAPNPDRILEVDLSPDAYQGVNCYIISGDDYYCPNWIVLINYGSCSGCDTLEAIRGYSDEPPTPEQVDGYITLALHIVQKLICISDAAAV